MRHPFDENVFQSGPYSAHRRCTCCVRRQTPAGRLRQRTPEPAVDRLAITQLGTLDVMICVPCREKRHKECPGRTWCYCQHRVRKPVEPATGPPGE